MVGRFVDRGGGGGVAARNAAGTGKGNTGLNEEKSSHSGKKKVFLVFRADSHAGNRCSEMFKNVAPSSHSRCRVARRVSKGLGLLVFRPLARPVKGSDVPFSWPRLPSLSGPSTSCRRSGSYLFDQATAARRSRAPSEGQELRSGTRDIRPSLAAGGWPG